MTTPIRVLLFARYAELLGSESVELTVPATLSVRELLDRVRSLPGGSGLPATVLCAVNLRQATLSDPVAPGDEVALLPPLAGG
jgi:molybdopterin converting factor small subunit